MKYFGFGLLVLGLILILASILVFKNAHIMNLGLLLAVLALGLLFSGNLRKWLKQ